MLRVNDIPIIASSVSFLRGWLPPPPLPPGSYVTDRVSVYYTIDTTQMAISFVFNIAL